MLNFTKIESLKLQDLTVFINRLYKNAHRASKDQNREKYPFLIAFDSPLQRRTLWSMLAQTDHVTDEVITNSKMPEMNRRDHTTISEYVNGATRLESAAARSTLLISEDIYDLIKE